MILTNIYKYPDAVVKAVRNGLAKPIPNMFRTTEIIDSPLIRRLLIEKWDEIEIDVDDFVYGSLFGTAWHKFLSQWEVNAMVERRWTISAGGVALSGQTDIYKPKIAHVEDNKVTGAYAFIFGNNKWKEQLNIYATLIEECGYPVKKLFINAFLRDWSRWEAQKKRKDYPRHKFHRVTVPLWPAEKRMKFIDERIKLHLSADDYVCTGFKEAGENNERWERPTKYAVMKAGQKAAKRVLDTKKEAEEWIKEKKPKGDITIVERPGECVRCVSYCTVRSVCPYKRV